MSASIVGGVGRYCVMRVIKFIALFAVLLGLSACNGRCKKFDEVKYFIEREIAVGDSRAKVDSVFSMAGFNYSYDEFHSRYQSSIRATACGEWVSLSVHVSFDKFGHVSKIEISEVYTGP